MLNPPPVRGRIPVLIGGGGEKVMLRLVAQWADTWHAFGAPERDRAQVRVLDEHCAAIGRDPAEIERSVLVTSEDIAGGLLDRYHELGARHIVAIAQASRSSTSPISGGCSPGATPSADGCNRPGDPPRPEPRSLAANAGGEHRWLRSCRCLRAQRVPRGYAPADGGRAFRRPARRALRER